MFAAQDILSYLVDDGLLFIAELSRDRIVECNAKGDAFAKDIPLVVRIDETTYTAGETVPAAVSGSGSGQTI